MLNTSMPIDFDPAGLIVRMLLDLPRQYLRMDEADRVKLEVWIAKKCRDLVSITWFELPDLTGRESWIDTRLFHDVALHVLPAQMAICVRQLIGIFKHPRYRDDDEYLHTQFIPLCAETHALMLEVWDELGVPDVRTRVLCDDGRFR